MTTLLSENKLKILIETLITQAPSRGYIAEVGVYMGGSIVAMARACPNTLCFGFDTFDGLPAEYDGDDEYHRTGAFPSRLDLVQKNVEKYDNISLYRGVFPKSVEFMNLNNFGFVHLDMDQWRGTKDAVEYFLPKMVKGGVIFFDDYNWPNCPGIKPLVDGLGYDVVRAGEHQAYIKVNL